MTTTPTSSRRPTLLSISVRRNAGEVTAAISLCLDGRTLTGEATRNDDDRERAIVMATLDAMRPLPGGEIEVESAQIVAIPGRRVAVVVLELPDGVVADRTLVGSALVRAEVEDALALSVLDALDHPQINEERP